MKLPNGMIVNDNLGRPRYIDRHGVQARKYGPRRVRKAYARCMRLIAKYALSDKTGRKR